MKIYPNQYKIVNEDEHYMLVRECTDVDNIIEFDIDGSTFWLHKDSVDSLVQVLQTLSVEE